MDRYVFHCEDGNNYVCRKGVIRMKIVIDIPDNIYDAIKSAQTIVSGQRSGKTLLQILVSSVENGTPLPKNHGRLIDADVLVEGMEDNYELCMEVNATPTIIPSEREEEE